jgi:hypothetical protein
MHDASHNPSIPSNCTHNTKPNPCKPFDHDPILPNITQESIGH